MATTEDGQTNVYNPTKEQVNSKYYKIVNEAVYSPAVSKNFDPTEPPEWYDPEKLAQSQNVCMRYFYSIFVSISIGNLLAFQDPSFVNPVLTTGNHSSIAKMYRRYLATAYHLLKWFQSDPFSPKSPAFKSFGQVRSMHIKLCTSMNRKADLKTGNVKLKLSLNDVIQSLFPFIGLLTNYPDACGAHGITKGELQQVLYAWRVFVYALGIDDKYNICDETIDDFQKLYIHFEHEYLVPLLKEVPNTSPIGWQLSQGYITALKQINVTLNFNSLICYWFNVIGVPLTKRLNLAEWMILKFNQFFTFYMLRIRYLYSLMNLLLIKRLEHHKKFRDQITNNLERRYSDVLFGPTCPIYRDPEYQDNLTD